MKKDARPKQYRYYDQLMQHLNGDESVFFNGELIYPRQFEIHLPSNHKIHCNLNCRHCQGRYFIRDLGYWELDALELMNKLKGAIPYHIYGGAYSEPMLNPYYLTFLATTKKYGNHFGIHTNGTMLKYLEENQGWLTELHRISTDDVDYLSISLDGGLPWHWASVKRTKKDYLFNDIIDGVKKACDIRRKSSKKSHAIRLCYLISPETGTYENFASIVSIAKDIGVDSLRFSIPYAIYNQDFDVVREYKKNVEMPGKSKYPKLLKEFLSSNENERPYIFYTGPEFTDVDKYTFEKCIYGYYQITYGADGYVYKCSAAATPTAKQCRIGKVTADLDEFNKMILRNYNEKWDARKMCFDKGVRCNRMALEINRDYERIKNG